MIPTVVHTCAACRAWAKPPPQNVASASLADEFNIQVEADLIFIYSFTILHFIDRCARWHAATVIPDRTTETLIATLDKEWVSVHGATKDLIMDQETGIANPMKSAQEQNLVKAYFDAKAIKYVPRAKEQHIGHIDRRGALLRDTIHSSRAAQVGRL